MNAPFVLLVVVTDAGVAAGQPATAVRFANGASQIAVEPGTAVLVSVYATNMPAIGTPIPWGFGHPTIGYYAGFSSVSMNLNAASTSRVGWSGLTIPAGAGYDEFFCHAGIVSGNNVDDIVVTVGFNPPVTGHEFLLWQGTVTVGMSNVSLATQIVPVSSPPETGFEAALSGVIPGFNVSTFIPALNGSGLIIVPAPATLLPAALACLAVPRRRREGAKPRHERACGRHPPPPLDGRGA